MTKRDCPFLVYFHNNILADMKKIKQLFNYIVNFFIALFNLFVYYSNIFALGENNVDERKMLATGNVGLLLSMILLKKRTGLNVLDVVSFYRIGKRPLRK